MCQGGGGTTAWKNMTRGCVNRRIGLYALPFHSAVSRGRYARSSPSHAVAATRGRYTRLRRITLCRYTQSAVTLIGRLTLSTVTRFVTRSCRPIHVTLGRPTRPLHSAVTLGRCTQSAVTLTGPLHSFDRYTHSSVTLRTRSSYDVVRAVRSRQQSYGRERFHPT